MSTITRTAPASRHRAARPDPLPVRRRHRRRRPRHRRRPGRARRSPSSSSRSGTAFVGLIKMMIQPVIFCTIVLGVGSVRQRGPGRQGRRARARLLPDDVDVRAGDRPGRRQHPAPGLRPAPHRRGVAARGRSRRRAGTAPPPTSCSASSRPRCSPRSPRARCCRPCWSPCWSASRSRQMGTRRRAGAARRRPPPAGGVPGAGDDHVGGADRRVRCDRRPWSARPASTRSRAWPC